MCTIKDICTGPSGRMLDLIMAQSNELKGSMVQI
jgi:hypothetical protein